VEPIKYAYFIRKILFDRVCVDVSSSDVCESNEESVTIIRSILDKHTVWFILFWVL
jgi:hypothetical protein